MALRALMLRKKIDDKKKVLEGLRGKDQDFKKREEDLQTSIEEAKTEEEQKVVEESVEAFEKEKEKHDKSKADLEKEISDLEADLAKEEEKKPAPQKKESERKNETMKNSETRTRFFGMSLLERDAFFANDKVKQFLSEVRTCIKEKRALNNIGLTIPDIMLPLLRQIAEETSKLVKYVSKQSVAGTSRQNIMGEIPEAFWDEMCASLKELDLGFYNMEMDGYKVSGYFAVCNAILEDSDINLAQELINAIGKAIGKALDKAIVYGKGVKMPLGIVASLTMKEAPTGYPETGREWKDLTATNIIAGTQTSGLPLFQEITKASGAVDNDYGTKTLVWLMNKTTHTNLVAEAMGFNANAAIVSGVNNTMPVVGGDIVEFKWIPDNTLIFGYFENYKLAERAGTRLGQSEHARFLEDQTVFRGTARYDGKPVIREAFAMFGIGKAPDTTVPKFAGEAATA